MILWSELQAWELLRTQRHPVLSNSVISLGPIIAHEAGNQIIALAERIKAERAVAAMEHRRG